MIPLPHIHSCGPVLHTR